MIDEEKKKVTYLNPNVLIGPSEDQSSGEIFIKSLWIFFMFPEMCVLMVLLWPPLVAVPSVPPGLLREGKRSFNLLLFVCLMLF